jgi:D-glycero-alpha-D-manno-heptose-7-phosphate kinase
MHNSAIQEMAELARDTFALFCNSKGADSGVEVLGKAIQHSWELKKIISNQIENERVNSLIKRGISAGAFGGKLCGAGGSGFVLFIVEPTNRLHFISKFQSEGAQEISISEHGSKSFQIAQR